MNKFERGKCYFLLGYYDRRFLYPYIQTFVFLGENLDSNDEGCWYFQSPDYYEEQVTLDFDSLDQSGVTIIQRDGLDGIFDRAELIKALAR